MVGSNPSITNQQKLDMAAAGITLEMISVVLGRIFMQHLRAKGRITTEVEAGETRSLQIQMEDFTPHCL